MLANAQTGAMTDAEKELLATAKTLMEKYEAAMEDDFNTADAISAIFELVKFMNTNANENNSKEYLEALNAMFKTMTDVCGIITEKKAEILDAEIEQMIADRQAARKAKDFAKADEIRNQLLEMGIVLEDTREGVKWKRA